MTTFVRSANSTAGGGVTSYTVAVSSTAGDTLVLNVLAFMAGNTPVHISSVTDSASNTWTYSTATANQNPPANGSYDAAQSQYGFTGLACCVGAAAVTSVTVTLSGATQYGEAEVAEFSGLPAGSRVLGGASSGTLASGVTSLTPPSVSASSPSAMLAVASTSGFGTFTSATSGWTTLVNADGNKLAAYNLAAASGTVSVTFTGSAQDVPSSAVLVIGHQVAAASAALSGSGSVAVSRLVTQPAAAALSGTSSLTPGRSVGTLASAALIGLGSVTAGAAVSMPGAGAANLDGSGALGAARTVTWQRAVPLSGSGTVSAQYTGVMQQAVPLAGAGTLGVAGAAALKFTAGLFGAGFLSIPQVAGGLVNGVGGAGTPQALPGSSQVAVAPPGSSNWQWLGTLGQVTALTYSYVCPGGCDKMSMTIMCPASFRTQLFNPGWKVKITRGGHQVWAGKLDEPQPSAQGWTLTAVGTGNLGQNFTSFYAPGDVWPVSEPDEIINRAIGRGLPWVNAGLNSSPYFSQFWLGQATDPGSSTVTAFLNLICTRGGLTWYVNSQPGGIYNGDDLSVFPLPTTPNRLLVCTTPVARTLGGYVNSIVIRYMQTADNTTTNVAATFAVVNALNQPSIAAHGVTEAYLDLSNASVLTPTQALAVGASIFQSYESASYAGPFQASYGQLLNMGGAPIDPGTDQAGTRVRLILVNGGYGGEVVPGTVEFTVGAYEWNDVTQVATLSPFQELDQSLSGLLSLAGTAMTPITVTGG